MDFSRVAVSSPVIDVSDFLYSSVHPGLISEHYVTLLQVNSAFHITRGEFRPLVIIPPFHLKAAHASCSLLGISRFWAPRLELLSPREIPGLVLKIPPPISPLPTYHNHRDEKICDCRHITYIYLGWHITYLGRHITKYLGRHITRPTWRRSKALECTATRSTSRCWSKNIRSDHQVIRSDPLTSTSSPWYDVDDDLLCTCTLPRLPEIYLKLVFSISIYGL